jgi:hypothetical protein
MTVRLNAVLLSGMLVYSQHILNSRSQWPRGLRKEVSSPARTLGSLVQIPLNAWMFVCLYSVFVLGSGPVTG